MATSSVSQESLPNLSEASKPLNWPAISAWFLISAVASTYANTAFLQEFNGDATALTLFRFLGSAILGCFANAFAIGGERISLRSLVNLVPSFIVPSLFLLGANLFNSISLEKGGITLTYIVKAGIPLVTVIICLIRRQNVSLALCLTLFPTVIGVALSAWADTQFSWEGFIAAWMSTISQTMMNITSKMSIQSSGLSGQRTQFMLVSIASCLMLLYDAFFGAVNWSGILELLQAREKSRMILLLTASAYHVEYVLNFIVTDNVSEVHFSVLDVARRLAIIVAGAVLFSKVLTPLNFFGVILALAGVLLFNREKRKENAMMKDGNTILKKMS